MNNFNLKLTPYLHFNGQCEEALNRYAEILGGTAEIIQRYDNPAMNAPEEYHNKVLHATLQFNGNTIFASDSFPGYELSRGSGDTALSLSVADSENAKIIFDLLSNDGQVNVPFEKQFWGSWHGNLKDKFGINWMINCEV